MDSNGTYYETNVQNLDINLNNIRCQLAKSSKSNLLDEYEIIRPNGTIHAGAAGASNTAPIFNKNMNQDKQEKQQQQNQYQYQYHQQQNVSNNVANINNSNNNNNNNNNQIVLDTNKKLISSTSSISNAKTNSIRPGQNSIETKSSTR